MSASNTYSQAGRSFSLPILGALFIHLVVAALLLGSWSFHTKKVKVFELPKHIVAEVVTLEKPKPVVKPKPVDRPKPVTKPTSKPAVKSKPKEVATTKPKETAAVEKVIDISKEGPKEALVVEEPPVVEKPVEIESDPEENLFEDLLAGLAAEEQEISQQIENIEGSKARAEHIRSQVNNYVGAITQQVEEKWSRPAELRLMDLANVEAKVAVEILPTGELQNASIVKSSGNTNYDQSVLRAIEKVRRFNVPEDSEVFEAGGFRRLNITFRPEDLMKP